MRKTAVIVAAVLLVCSRPVAAQVLVVDPVQNVKLSTLGKIQEAAQKVIAFIDDETRRFGRPFSLFADLHRYVSPDAPLWRTRRSDAVSCSDGSHPSTATSSGTPSEWTDQQLRDHIAAELSRVHSTDDPAYWFRTIRDASRGDDWAYWVGRMETGDGACLGEDGAGPLDASLPQTVAFMDAVNGRDTAGTLVDPALVRRTLPPADIPADLRIDLATVDMADSAIHSAIDTTGQIRGRRREELSAILAAVDHLVGNGSVGKALEKISGGAVIRAQQQSTRLALTGATLDLLLVRGKRMRDAQAEHLMLAAAALQEAPNMAAGSGAAIASWRQP